MPFTLLEVRMMVVTLEEMKQYLRVDYEDDDQLIYGFYSIGGAALPGCPPG